MNFYYQKKKNFQYPISGSKLFQFIVNLWKYEAHVLYFQFNTATKYPKSATLQINVWVYIQRGQNSSEIISRIYCSAMTAEETWEDLNVLSVAACFLGCLGSFWCRTQQISNSPITVMKVLSQHTDPSLGSSREAFYPYCGLWFAQISPAISNARPFKIYCTIETCKFYDSTDSNLFSPLMKINNHSFFKGKRQNLNCACWQSSVYHS